jgi:hypothetical protein
LAASAKTPLGHADGLSPTHVPPTDEHARFLPDLTSESAVSVFGSVAEGSLAPVGALSGNESFDVAPLHATSTAAKLATKVNETGAKAKRRFILRDWPAGSVPVS